MRRESKGHEKAKGRAWVVVGSRCCNTHLAKPLLNTCELLLLHLDIIRLRTLPARLRHASYVGEQPAASLPVQHLAILIHRNKHDLAGVHLVPSPAAFVLRE